MCSLWLWSRNCSTSIIEITFSWEICFMVWTSRMAFLILAYHSYTGYLSTRILWKMSHLWLYKRHQKIRFRVSVGFLAFYLQLSLLNWFEDFHRLDSLWYMFKAMVQRTSPLLLVNARCCFYDNRTISYWENTMALFLYWQTIRFQENTFELVCFFPSTGQIMWYYSCKMCLSTFVPLSCLCLHNLYKKTKGKFALEEGVAAFRKSCTTPPFLSKHFDPPPPPLKSSTALVAPAGISSRGEIPGRHPSSSRVY